jgi:hypothetical protein
MAHDPMETLIREADAAAGEAPRVGADLAGRVEALGRRRKRTRVAGMSAAGIAFVIGIGMVWTAGLGPEVGPGEVVVLARGGESKAQTDAEVARLREEIEILRAQADAYKALADRLLMEREDRALVARSARPISGAGVLDPIQTQLDRAAFTMMYQADRMREELNLPGSAAEQYRRVIELFGQTRWAEVARDRLKEMKTSKGDVL